jgi:hypothetical protein
MKFILQCFLLQIILLTSSSLYAQVGIGTTLPDASSALDIFSTSKGFLMPRLTTVQRDLITSPATGLMIYNTSLDDGQINIGTPAVPNWIGLKKPEQPMIYSDNGVSDLVITSSTNLAASDLLISPSTGSYLALFSAQMFGATNTSTSFDSSTGVTDLTSLYNELIAFPGGVAHGLTFGSGETLAPGVYDVAGAPSIAGTLTLAGGTATANPIFIIRAPGAFTTAVNTTLVLTGNAKPENIYWVCGAAMSTAGSTIMKGIMIGGGSGAGAVSLGADSDLEGRLFTRLGAVTMGANAVINTPVGNAAVNLGTLSSFAMWSSDGGVSDVATATTTGDVGTAAGVLSMTGSHTGVEYSAGTQGGNIANISTTTYSIFINGTEVANSRRTIKRESSLVSFQAMITLLTDGIPVELRWKVDEGSATLSNRSFSLIRSEH